MPGPPEAQKPIRWQHDGATATWTQPHQSRGTDGEGQFVSSSCCCCSMAYACRVCSAAECRASSALLRYPAQRINLDSLPPAVPAIVLQAAGMSSMKLPT